MDNPWEYFLNRLFASIIGIPNDYFLIPRHSDTPATRERAYCYELYHQLRCSLANEFSYTLHGEIDKRGSRLFNQVFEGHTPNPDFVVHKPGTMDNLVIIEVKSSNCTIRQATDDINKISTFINELDYQHGIFLVFGPMINDQLVRNLTNVDRRITFLWHASVGAAADIIWHGE